MFVTLSIGAASIRLLTIKGKRVAKWGEVPLEPGLVQDGLILHQNSVAAAINGLFQSLKVSRGQVITSLSGLSFTYRTLSLPAMSPDLQEEAILRGMKREIPVPVEDLYLTWQRVEDSGNERSYFVLGVPRNFIDTLVQTLTEAGVKPYLIDLRGLALARAASRADTILLSLEPDYFDIVLIANGRLATMHTAMPRGEGASIEDNMTRAVDAISKTVGFYNSSHPEEPFSPTTLLLLTGELSTDPAVSQILQEETGYPVEPLVPPIVLPPDFPIALYTGNIGLALKKMRPSAKEARYHDININLLPERYRAESPRAAFSRLLVPAVLVIAIGLLLPAYQVKSLASNETARLEAELLRVNEELHHVRLEADKAALTEETILQLSAELESLQQQQQILSEGGDLADSLETVNDIFSQQGYSTSIEIEGDQVVARGQTSTAADVIACVTALENLGYFSEVRIDEMEVEEADEESEYEEPEVSFTLVMTR